MGDIKVSVCIPVYNVATSLEACLESIIHQTLEDIEIICVDDGSTDNSLEVLNKYSSIDNRIIVIHKENGGLPTARNAALNVAKGEFVGFVDSDDYIQENMYERLYNVAKKEDCDVVICGANIYPEEPRANQWYYDTLSPTERLYEEYNPEILYSCVDTSPFLWRTMVRRSLIEDNNLRLDEEITLGEDKAFQAKVYPLAKRIKVISDKLYNYCWYRTDSLMEQDTRCVSDKKGRLHAKLILSMIRDGKFADKNEALLFCKWSIPFLYADFITVSLQDKQLLAKQLVEAWNGMGYQKIKYELDAWIRDEFEYIELMSKTNPYNPKVSVVMLAASIGKRLMQCIDDVRRQDLNDIEIIVINNGVEVDLWHKLEDVIKKDVRVRVYNTPKHLRFGDEVISGLELAQGSYIHFFAGDGKYADSDSLAKWYEYTKNNDLEVCGVLPVQASNFATYSNEAYYMYKNENIHDTVSRLSVEHVLFNKEYLAQTKYRMRCLFDFTGNLFVALSTYNSSKVGMYSEDIFVSKVSWKRDWISTEQCEYLLTTIRECVEVAIREKQWAFVNYLYSIISDEETEQIIVNNTKMYAMHTWERPNGDNSQYKILNELYKLMSMYPAEELFNSGYYSEHESMKILNDIVLERQVFLNAL